MAIDFIVGDTVDVLTGGATIRGEVTRIDTVEDVPQLIEIQRPSGSHNEYPPDENANPGDEFAFIEKVA